MNSRLPETEGVDSATAQLDACSAADAVRLLAAAQQRAVEAVVSQADALGALVERIASALAAGNTLHYAGAGTSGRLGVLDASEMPPTFGTPPELICAHIAGGDRALRRSVEGAEDDGDAGTREMRDHVRAGDVVIGISASGGAPYVAGALDAARSCGAYSVAFVDVDGPCALALAAETTIVLRTGAEPLSGSTRLTAGTAAKIALNAVSTAVMVRLGKVYGNLMVDVVASNAKLRTRARRLVERIGRVDAERAQQLLDAADGRVKVAIVMARANCDAAAAREQLARANGYLRTIIG